MSKFSKFKIASLPVWLRFILLAVVIGFLLRIVLLAITPYHLPIVDYWIFLVGAVNDTMVMSIMLVPMALWYLSMSRWRLNRPQGYVFLALLVVGWIILQFFAKPLVEFNKGLHRALCWVMVYWIVSYALRMFLPGIRKGWDRVWTVAIIGIYLILMVFNIMGELLFWEEFEVRYNFIAVDYLVYTNEVVGNINQSYPMGWIISGIILVSALLEWLLFRDQWRDPKISNFYGEGKSWKSWYWYPVVLVLSGLLIVPMASLQDSDNVYRNELQASGIYSFCKAFFLNKIDYDSFYYLPQSSAGVVLPGRDNAPSSAVADTSEDNYDGGLDKNETNLFLTDSIPSSPICPNIVLITMESMSAEYLEHFGNEEHLTPALDSLYNKSLAFNRMFAAGNRTVRGLEALTLSRPPSPGESIIKREDNMGYPSISDALNDRGYDRFFLYGGDSYFDNMEAFYTNLGYNIIDDGNFTSNENHFRTVWGICDGDVYDKLIKVADSCSISRKPFFVHMLTTSNHRPYIYPDGLISIPPSEKSRKGGVMYADYAVGDFFRKAQEKDWFNNTVFVFVADHCASSAGKVELPLEAYQIPALIYAPNLVQPQVVDKVVSQIDIMPTVFALLGWEADNNLYGKNALSQDYESRAFLATYQDLGYFENDTLTVLSPGQKIRQYEVTPTQDNPLSLTPIEKPSTRMADRAATYYRHSSNTR